MSVHRIQSARGRYGAVVRLLITTTIGRCNQVWHWDNPTDYFAHAQAVLTECAWANMLEMENGGKSKIFFFLMLLINIITAI